MEWGEWMKSKSRKSKRADYDPIDYSLYNARLPNLAISLPGAVLI